MLDWLQSRCSVTSARRRMVWACAAANDRSNRAIDLTFEHFAQFGRDDDVIDLLAGAIELVAVSERARLRFAELRASPQ
jgi:hypothetical protein